MPKLHPSRATCTAAQCHGFTTDHRQCRLQRDQGSLFCGIHQRYPETYRSLFRKAAIQFPVWFSERQTRELLHAIKFRTVPFRPADINAFTHPHFLHVLFRYTYIPESWFTEPANVRYIMGKAHITLEDLDCLIPYRSVTCHALLVKLVLEDIEDTFFRPIQRMDSFEALLKHPYWRDEMLGDDTILDFVRTQKESLVQILWRYVVSAQEEAQQEWETYIYNHLDDLKLPAAEKIAKEYHRLKTSPFKEELLPHWKAPI